MFFDLGHEDALGEAGHDVSAHHAGDGGAVGLHVGVAVQPAADGDGRVLGGVGHLHLVAGGHLHAVLVQQRRLVHLAVALLPGTGRCGVWQPIFKSVFFLLVI